MRALGLAAVTAPATAALVPEKLANVRSWWVPVGQWVKEFDYGRVLGVARAYRNVLTGERVRHAVRMAGIRHPYGEEVRRGISRLDQWAADLPPWRRPATPGRGHFDDVLEGREDRVA
mgnify:FL=1